jgi:iron(III) transport system ATP-binding protein
VPGVVASSSADEVVVETVEGRLVSRGGTLRPAVGTDVLLSVRPECVDIATTPQGRVNEWAGQVLTRAFLGDAVDHVVAVGKQEVRTRSNPTRSIEPGTRVHLTVDPSGVTVVPAG